MSRLRKIVQVLFLLLFLFLFLQTESKGRDVLGYPVRLFLDFDPLIMVTTLLAAHAVPAAFLLSLLLIGVTLLSGRVFCGWACPLGTICSLVADLRTFPFRPKLLGWFRLKYILLIFLLVSSLLTLQLVGIIDPLSLLIRSLSLSTYPVWNYAVRAFLDTIGQIDLPGAATAAEWVYGLLKKSVLAFHQPYALQSMVIGSLFWTIVGLNLVERNLWCRYLCPLGAFLGLLSRHSIVKREVVSEGCTSCGACVSGCEGAAVPDRKGGWKGAECFYCGKCSEACKRDAVRFRASLGKAGAGLDLGKRRVILAAAAGILAVPVLRTTPLAGAKRSDPGLIRPPGSVEESEFLRRCVKCGECMKVCVTNGLQPALLEAGIEGIWSPLLVPRIGHCDYHCTLCGQVCPTGAIRRLDPEEKMKTRIGLARIDRGRCLPYAHGMPCTVCEEACPTSRKAIWFEESRVKDRAGRETVVRQPKVDLDLCVGCGICEAECPVVDRPAIFVTSLGESRSRKNRLLLK
jgi:ferredoxin